MAADIVIIPLFPSDYAVDGIEGMVVELYEVSKMREAKMTIRILLGNTDNTIETREARQELKKNFQQFLFKTQIPNRRMVRTAQRYNKSVIRHAPENDASEAFIRLTGEVLQL